MVPSGSRLAVLNQNKTHHDFFTHKHTTHFSILQSKNIMSTDDSTLSPVKKMGNDTTHAILPQNPNTLPPFHRIGYGDCESVWSIEKPGMNTSVIKREDINEARSVYNDFLMHRKLLSAIQELRLSPETAPLTSRVSVPACHQYVFEQMRAPGGIRGLVDFRSNIKLYATLSSRNVFPLLPKRPGNA